MKRLKLLPLIIGLFAALSLSSCASMMNVHNNKSWKMGIDVVTTKTDSLTVLVNDKPATYYTLYDGDYYHVKRVVLNRPRKKIKVTITQNNVTKTAHIQATKVRGLFWVSGLFVILDHIKGTLIKYPAINFDELDPTNG